MPRSVQDSNVLFFICKENKYIIVTRTVLSKLVYIIIIVIAHAAREKHLTLMSRLTVTQILQR